MSSGTTYWDTLPSERTVLAVARTIASTIRVLDVVSLFEDDARVRVQATIVPGSPFGAGVDDLLANVGIRPLPWKRAVKSTFDLALSASANGKLHRLKAPLVLFPHGAGHHKKLPAILGGIGMSDLASTQLLRYWSVIPTRIMLPGRDSLLRLEADCRKALPRARVAGDPVAQQIRDHVSLRDSFRAAIGLRPGQRLVVVSSTWGPGSLATRSPGLLNRLMAELPMDDYRVAAIFHHNVTAQDGPGDLRRRLSKAIDSGLITMPPALDWQSSIIAADCVLGDHGSATFYAADVAPVAIVTHAPDEYPADGPTSALVNTVPHLDMTRPLLPQVERLIASPKSDAVTSIIDSSIDRDVNAAAVFRSTMYELLRLDEPSSPAHFPPIDEPRPDNREVTAYLAHPVIDDRNATVTLTRYPAVTSQVREDHHLVVHSNDLNPRRQAVAAVLVSVYRESNLAELIRQSAGCRVAVRPLMCGRYQLRDRDGSDVIATTNEPSSVASASLVASTYYGLAHAGLPVERQVTVRCGGRVLTVGFQRPSTG